MRIGLLVCDHVHPRFRHISGDYPDMFADLFAAQPGAEIVPYDLVASAQPDLRECEAWLTTGSAASVGDEEPWIERLMELVRQAHATGTPFFGVCFGHQMIARALGGRVARSPHGWGVGVKEVTVWERAAWMEPARSSFLVLNSHRDQVTELPPSATVLAGNDHCPVGMLTVGERMAGMQGHPEFTPAYAQALMEWRVERGILPPEVAEAARPTFQLAPDRELLAGWIARFLSGEGRYG